MKQIFCSILFLAAGLLISCAQKSDTPKPATDKPAAAIDIAKPVGWVNDYTGTTLTDEQQSQLSRLIDSFEKATGNEIAIVTVKTTQPLSIEEYSLKLFKDWGVGKKDKNNGVMILAAMQDRKVRISTGTGIEKILTNDACKNIIDSIIKPYFKKAEYFPGLLESSQKIMTILSTPAELK